MEKEGADRPHLSNAPAYRLPVPAPPKHEPDASSALDDEGPVRSAESSPAENEDEYEQDPDTSHLRDAWVGELAPGCEACMEGAKMVLFVTGRCTRRCFYCPISEEKWQADVIYANEKFIGRRELQEARAGAGQAEAGAAREAAKEEAKEEAHGTRPAMMVDTASASDRNAVKPPSSAGEPSDPAGLLLHEPSEHNEDELLTEAELEAIMEEGEAMDALGTGITGGDPMDVPQRVLHVIRALKTHFGSGHHLHMYTSGSFEARFIQELELAGLDELRFHPPPTHWTRLPGSALDAVIRLAAASTMDVGVEVPALPGHRKQLEALIGYLESVGAGDEASSEGRPRGAGDGHAPMIEEEAGTGWQAGEASRSESEKEPKFKSEFESGFESEFESELEAKEATELDAGQDEWREAGIAFVNLNELEISDTNYERLVGKGVAQQKLQDSYGVAGSEELALKLVDNYEGPLALHYCSSAYKDAVQHRQRLIRRARKTARPYEELTADGTIIKGIIEVLKGKAEAKGPKQEAKFTRQEAKATGEDEVRKALEMARARLFQRYDLPAELWGIDIERHRLELPADFLEEIADELSWPCFIVEELPIATRLEVERRPL